MNEKQVIIYKYRDLMSEIQKLEAEAKELKKEISSWGEMSYEGSNFVLTVSKPITKTVFSLDKFKVLNPDIDYSNESYYTTSTTSPMVRLTWRKENNDDKQ